MVHPHQTWRGLMPLFHKTEQIMHLSFIYLSNLYSFVAFPSSKTVYVVLQKWTVPWKFIHPSLELPIWPKPFQKGGGLGSLQSLRRLGHLSPCGVQFVKRNLSTLCHKQPHGDKEQQKIQNVLHVSVSSSVHTVSCSCGFMLLDSWRGQANLPTRSPMETHTCNEHTVSSCAVRYWTKLCCLVEMWLKKD